MKANELKIGNLIHVDFGLPSLQEHYVCAGDFGDIYVDKLKESQLIPIELTEEWLIKYGYEEEIREWKGNGQDWQPETSKTKQIRYELTQDIYLVFEYFSYRAKETDPWMEDRNIFIDYHGDSIYLTNYYIHTLQNLYFSLTGEELKLK